MKNITELRNNLAAIFDELRAGTIDIKAAAEMNNTAGKIIGTVKAELEYAALRKEEPSIAFLNSEPVGNFAIHIHGVDKEGEQ